MAIPDIPVYEVAQTQGNAVRLNAQPFVNRALTRGKLIATAADDTAKVLNDYYDKMQGVKRLKAAFDAHNQMTQMNNDYRADLKNQPDYEKWPTNYGALADDQKSAFMSRPDIRAMPTEDRMRIAQNFDENKMSMTGELQEMSDKRLLTATTESGIKSINDFAAAGKIAEAYAAADLLGKDASTKGGANLPSQQVQSLKDEAKATYGDTMAKRRLETDPQAALKYYENPDSNPNSDANMLTGPKRDYVIYQARTKYIPESQKLNLDKISDGLQNHEIDGKESLDAFKSKNFPGQSEPISARQEAIILKGIGADQKSAYEAVKTQLTGLDQNGPDAYQNWADIGAQVAGLAPAYKKAIQKEYDAADPSKPHAIKENTPSWQVWKGAETRLTQDMTNGAMSPIMATNGMHFPTGGKSVQDALNKLSYNDILREFFPGTVVPAQERAKFKDDHEAAKNDLIDRLVSQQEAKKNALLVQVHNLVQSPEINKLPADEMNERVQDFITQQQKGETEKKVKDNLKSPPGIKRKTVTQGDKTYDLASRDGGATWYDESK